jgi:hypothetical protein
LSSKSTSPDDKSDLRPASFLRPGSHLSSRGGAFPPAERSAFAFVAPRLQAGIFSSSPLAAKRTRRLSLASDVPLAAAASRTFCVPALSAGKTGASGLLPVPLVFRGSNLPVHPERSEWAPTKKRPARASYRSAALSPTFVAARFYVECGSSLPPFAKRACPRVLLASTWERQSPDWLLPFPQHLSFRAERPAPCLRAKRRDAQSRNLSSMIESPRRAPTLACCFCCPRRGTIYRARQTCSATCCIILRVLL